MLHLKKSSKLAKIHRISQYHELHSRRVVRKRPGNCRERHENVSSWLKTKQPEVERVVHKQVLRLQFGCSKQFAA